MGRRRITALRKGRGRALHLLRRIAAWLAVFALLVQVAVPELAMAAQDAAAASATRHAGHHHHPGSVPDASNPRPDDRPSPAHDHGAFCPFCIAQAAHGLVPVPAAGIPLPVALGPAAPPPADTGIVPERHFLSCLHCRAPPRLSRI